MLAVIMTAWGTGRLEAQQVTLGDENTVTDSTVSALLPIAASVTPGGAFLRAVLVPGWGHVSIGANARAGVYFAIESAVAYGIIRTRRRISEAVSQPDWEIQGLDHTCNKLRPYRLRHSQQSLLVQ